MLVEQGTMEAFNDAVGLWAPHADGAMGDILKLQEQLIGMLVGPAAELPPIVGKHRFDLHAVRLEGGEDIIVLPASP
jgi:hypothetical protein